MSTVGFAALVPLTVAVAGAVLVLVVDLFPAGGRQATGLLTALAAAATGAAALLGGLRSPAAFCSGPASCAYVLDGRAVLVSVLAAGAAVVAALLSAPLLAGGRVPGGEYGFLMLAALAGAVTVAGARDLLVLVVGIETVTLPTYVLTGLRRLDPRAVEGALTYFLVSVTSSAVMLLGVALLYGATGSLRLAALGAARADVPHAGRALLGAGAVLVVVGFAFKAAIVPFHWWAPDVYQAAPLPVASFLATVSKTAGFAGLLLLAGALTGSQRLLAAVFAVLAAATMTYGNLAALRQTRIVRLLAWSSVAQAGYVLAPLAVAGTAAAPVLGRAHAAVLSYLAIYVVTTAGAFGCVVAAGRRQPVVRIEDLRGLASGSPGIAVLLAFFLLSLAGLPPALAGLFAKVVVIRALVDGGVGWLAVLAAVTTVIGLAYYVRVAALLFAPRARTGAESESRQPPAVLAGVGLATLVAVVVSVAPQGLLGAADRATAQPPRAGSGR